ncbi:DUF4197 domain-containing protein [Pseudopedobacter beijingensis]|uniref:DUF4197 domain-containing protein n=1 Tax=Pseudopedobacter beijingensis TaxID=1207056 RepID=A0ABW4IBE3_9SPHI
MKKTGIAFLLISVLGLSGCESLNQVANQYGGSLGTVLTTTPTNIEIGTALRQALEEGTGISTAKLSSTNGFLGNAAVKILMPPEAQKVESTLRSLGLNSLCDNVITSLNRAAEDAVKEAKPIFVSAIKQMTFQDVTNILLGNSDAATQYFKRTTSAALAEKFRPIVNSSISKVGATKYWSDLASAYNKVPTVKPVTTDLTSYVTDKAIAGLFVEIATEELKIRQNVNARSTATMQKVFAYADQQKK